MTFNRIRISILILAFGCVIAPAAHAAKDSADAPIPWSETQAGMDETAGRAYEKADKQLNKVYSHLIRQLSPPVADKLKTAEKVWIAYRNAEATFESYNCEGGSVHPMILYGNLEGVTEERTESLKKLSRSQKLPHWSAEQASLQYATDDAKLNMAYRKLSSLVAGEGPGPAEFKAAEKLWIAFRDAEATYESAKFEGLPTYAAARNAVLAKITRDRTAYLNGIIKYGTGFGSGWNG